MASKKQRKAQELKAKKKKKKLRTSLLIAIILIVAGFFILFSVSLFDYLYLAPSNDRQTSMQREKAKVRLYFADANERFLVPEIRYLLTNPSRNDQAREIVEALIEGPKSGLTKTFPDDTEIKSVKVENDGIALVSFGKNLIDLHPGGSTSEATTIYSLTNTLVSNLPYVNKVKILIDGKEIESLKGHINTRNPFTLNKELIVTN